MKRFVLLALSVSVGCGLAQDAPRTQTPGDTGVPILARPYEAARDFFNFYAFANAVVDSTGLLAGATSQQAGFGEEVGGGISGYHRFETGDFSLSYRGSYRTYQTSGYPDGSDQNLSFTYNKTFHRRWQLGFAQGAGIYLYDGFFYSPNPTDANLIQTNPFGSETKFTLTNLSLAYQQSLRLSYQFTGSFLLERYNAAGSIGSDSVNGSASALYRLTRTTTLSGSYSHSYFTYQRGAGSSNVDSVYLTLSRNLANHWKVGVSGGASISNTSGTLNIPANAIVGQEIIPVFVLGRYSTKSTLPYYQGTLIHSWRHSLFTATGGQSVNPGNGFYLTSRNLGVSGIYQYMFRQSNVAFGGFFSKLSSLSNPVAASFYSTQFTASYSYNLRPHIGLNGHYEFARYDNVGAYAGRSDNRLYFGVYVSSKNIPMGLY